MYVFVDDIFCQEHAKAWLLEVHWFSRLSNVTSHLFPLSCCSVYTANLGYREPWVSQTKHSSIPSSMIFSGRSRGAISPSSNQRNENIFYKTSQKFIKKPHIMKLIFIVKNLLAELIQHNNSEMVVMANKRIVLCLQD